MNDGELEMEARLAGNLAQMSTIQARHPIRISSAGQAGACVRQNGRSCAEKLAKELAV
jgi:hypothetical protein